MHILARFILMLVLAASFALSASAQDRPCRVAAADAAKLLLEARTALANANPDGADALIVQAYDVLAADCPTVESREVTSPEPTAEPSAPPAEATPSAGNFTINPPQVDAGKSAFFIRFAHTGIDSGPLDFYVRALGDTPLVQNIAFGETTGLITMPVGNHTIHVRPAGSGPGAEPLSTLRWDFVGNSTWVVTSAGLVSTYAFITEPVNIIRTRLDGRARVRVVNWVAGAERLSVASDRGISFGDGLGWVGIKDVEVDPGDYALQVTGASGSVYTEPVAFTFAADHVYTLLIAGSKDGDPAIRLMTLESPQDQTRVRFVNQRADAVDLHIRPGNARIIENLQPGASTDYIGLPSGAATFVAYAPGEGPRGQEKAALAEQLRPGRDLSVTLGANGQMSVTESVFTP